MVIWSFVQIIFSVVLITIYYYSEKTLPSLTVKTFGGKKKRIYISDVFIASILVIVAGIRCNCGSDYYNYYIQYTHIQNWYSSIWEVMHAQLQSGYQDLCYLTSTLFGGEFTIFFVIEICVAFPIILWARKRGNYPVESISLWILLGYYALSLNILKQIMAMVLVIYALDAISIKKYFKFTLLAIMACLFHLSAIFAVFAILVVDKIKYTKNLFCYLLLGSLALVALFEWVMRLATRFVPAKYVSYIRLALGESGAIDTKLRLGGILVSIMYIYLLYMICESKVNFDQYQIKMIKVMILAIPFLCFGIRYYLINRVSYYMVQFVVLLLPEYLHSLSKKKRRNIWLMLVAFCMCFAILCAENNYYSYSTIFTDVPMSVHDFIYRK